MSYPGLPIALPRTRAQLANVLAKAGDLVRVEDAAEVLDLSRSDAAKRLSRWTEQGWLRRAGRGIYVPVSLDTLDAPLILEDPWILVPALYAPAYVGGRTAAEHWDLTEQIFDDIVVVTAQPVREKSQVRHGARFTLCHRQADKIFGDKPVWRHHTKVPVSDVHRTIVDMLDEPPLGGGIQHVSDCLRAYLKRGDRDDRRLIDYASRLGNGAVFKRLGFLCEREPNAANLADECDARLSAGNAKLDPALDCPRLITRWRLLVPQTWAKAGAP